MPDLEMSCIYAITYTVYTQLCAFCVTAVAPYPGAMWTQPCNYRLRESNVGFSKNRCTSVAILLKNLQTNLQLMASDCVCTINTQYI